MEEENLVSDPTSNITSELFANDLRDMTPSASFKLAPVHENLALAVAKFVEGMGGEQRASVEWAALRNAHEAQEAELAALRQDVTEFKAQEAELDALRAENSRLRRCSTRKTLVIADDVLEDIFLFYDRQRLETKIRKICRRWDLFILARSAHWPKYSFSCVSIGFGRPVTFSRDHQRYYVTFERLSEEWARRSFEFLLADDVFIESYELPPTNIAVVFVLSEMQKMWPRKEWPREIQINKDDDLEKLAKLDCRIDGRIHVFSSWLFRGISIFKFPLIRHSRELELYCPSKNFLPGEVDGFVELLYSNVRLASSYDKRDEQDDDDDYGYERRVINIGCIQNVEMLEELVNAIRTAFLKDDRRRNGSGLLHFVTQELPTRLKFEKEKKYTNGHSTLTFSSCMSGIIFYVE